MDKTSLAEMAALGTSLCWSFSSIFFTIGSQRVGAMVVNRFRLLLAVILVGIAHVLSFGVLFPVHAGPVRFAWLGLSGIVGLVLGDSLLFYAYRVIGTRLGMLLLGLNPIFGAAFAWLLLGESMSLVEVGAMCLALGGVAWVVMERANGEGHDHAEGRKRYAIAILCALGAAVCQALGLITAKPALEGGFPALSALIIRMSTAMIVIWVWAALQHQVLPTVRTLRSDRRAELAILGGALTGPFLGVWLSLIAVQSARVGIASTLMAMSPILLLPMVRWVFKERVSPRAAGGTVLAMAGIVLMLLQ